MSKLIKAVPPNGPGMAAGSESLCSKTVFIEK